jgi:hypothetical protein
MLVLMSSIKVSNIRANQQGRTLSSQRPCSGDTVYLNLTASSPCRSVQLSLIFFLLHMNQARYPTPLASYRHAASNTTAGITNMADSTTQEPSAPQHQEKDAAGAPASEKLPPPEELEKAAGFEVLAMDGKAHSFASLYTGPDVASRVSLSLSDTSSAV